MKKEKSVTRPKHPLPVLLLRAVRTGICSMAGDTPLAPFSQSLFVTRLIVMKKKKGVTR